MPRYPLKNLSLILQFFCCALLLLNSPISHALIIEAKAIEQQFSKSASFGLSKTDTADLQRFYTARNYQPVWVTPEPGSSLLKIAFTFIANAESEGLDSHDYHLQQLQQLRQQIGQSLPAAIELEMRTTHALLILARDLSRGRFTAAKACLLYTSPSPRD